MNLLGTEDPRYSLKTLQAMYYGASYSGCSAHGAIHITFRDDDSFGIHTGRLLSVDSSGICARDDDGTVRTDIEPDCIISAEVI